MVFVSFFPSSTFRWSLKFMPSSGFWFVLASRSWVSRPTPFIYWKMFRWTNKKDSNTLFSTLSLIGWKIHLNKLKYGSDPAWFNSFFSDLVGRGDGFKRMQQERKKRNRNRRKIPQIVLHVWKSFNPVAVHSDLVKKKCALTWFAPIWTWEEGISVRTKKGEGFVDQ